MYQLCWHLGASQGDIASLKGEDVDWQNSTVSFTRKKTGVPVLVVWHLVQRGLLEFVSKTCPAKARCFLICPVCVLATAPQNLLRVADSLGLSA